MERYFLTRTDGTCRRGITWEAGVEAVAMNANHAFETYATPLSAVLYGPLYEAAPWEFRVWRCEAIPDETVLFSEHEWRADGIRERWPRMRALEEVPAPVVPLRQRIFWGLLALHEGLAVENPAFAKWESSFFAGGDEGIDEAYESLELNGSFASPLLLYLKEPEKAPRYAAQVVAQCLARWDAAEGRVTRYREMEEVAAEVRPELFRRIVSWYFT